MKIIVRFKDGDIIGFNASWFRKTEDELHIYNIRGYKYVAEHYNLAEINAIWANNMCIYESNLEEVRR